MSATLIRRSGLAVAVTLLALAAILSGRGTAPADGADPGPVSESRSLAGAPNADPDRKSVV